MRFFRAPSLKKADAGLSRAARRLAGAAAGVLLLTAGQAAAEEKLALTVSLLKGNALSYIPVLADVKGLWAANGLDVSFVNVTNGPAFISSVLSGSADGGVTAFSLTVPAEQKGGARMVAIAGDIGRASYAIAVRPELADQVKGDWLAVAQALKGTRFGVPSLGGEVGFVFQGFLREAGLDPKGDLTILQSGSFTASAAALKRGDIDAYIGSSYAQLLGLQDQGIAKIVLDLNEADPFKTWIQTGFFVREDLVKEKPEVVRRAQRALKATHEWLQKPENFVEAHRIANEIFPISEQAMKDFISRFEYELDEPSVTANIEFFRKSGIITLPVGYAELVVPHE